MSTFGILVLISLVCIAYGILSPLYQFYIIMRSVVVPGTVTGKWEQRVEGVRRGQSRESGIGTHYSNLEVNVVVSFQPLGSATPVTREIRAPLSSHPVGSQVEVIYLMGNLRSARIKEKQPTHDVFRRWIQPCLVLGLGLFIAYIFILAPLLGTFR